MPLRFHLDENVSNDVARALRMRGIDVTTTADAGLVRATDSEQLAFVNQERRAFVTRDADFLRMSQAGAEHYGTFFWSPHKRDLSNAVRTLSLIGFCLATK